MTIPCQLRTVVCIGGGRYGSRAAAEARDRGDRVLVVDSDEHCPARGISTSIADGPDAVLGAAEGDVLFLRGDGVRTLADLLDRWVPDAVVPAARGHLAALLAVEHARRVSRELVPAPDTVDAVRSRLPSGSICLADEKNAVLVTSYMSHGRCAEDCAQPAVCPVTGRESAVPMNELVDEALKGRMDRRIVLVTRGQGVVGEIKGEDLMTLLSLLDETRPGTTMGIATACGCHGIVNLLRVVGH